VRAALIRRQTGIADQPVRPQVRHLDFQFV
jgi:hypothetical protein